MRLRRSRPYAAGIIRIRRGRGFSYITAEGERLDDDDVLDRIRSLVIPPAWRKVWICEYPNGHIQAVGLDAAGRRQYIYHERWREERDEEKFDRVLDFATRLPVLRAQVTDDLAARGLGRTRVQALAVRLIDRGVFRVGGEQYASENGTYGVATMLRSQVVISGDELRFDYPAKGGIRRELSIHDPLTAVAVRALRRVGADSERLLVYRDRTGFHHLHDDDVNARLREIAAMECSAKDLRTWWGTVQAAAAFGALDPPTSKRALKSAEAQVMADVAEILGNTPAVARGSYVDPRVIEAFEAGATIAAALRRAGKAKSDDDQQAIVDKAVIRLIRRQAKA